MMTVIKTLLVKIGNSHGIHILKFLLALRPVRLPRQGWEEQYQRMAASGEDRLLDAATLSLTPTRWESKEWEW